MPLGSTCSRTWLAIISIRQHMQSDDVRHEIQYLPLDNTDGRTTSGVSCYHLPLLAHTVRRHLLWQCISSAFECTHGRTTSGAACHHLPWKEYTIGRCWAWYVINVLEEHTRLEDVEHVLRAWTLGSTHGRMMSGMACNHLHWAAHAVGRRWA